MSRSGAFYAEIWRNDQWKPIPTPKFSKGKEIPIPCVSPGTAYELYAALAGYERWGMYPLWHTEPIVPLSEPRGFPNDLNLIYKKYFGYNEYPESNKSAIKNALFHTNQQYLTWFLVQEVNDYDWDRKFPPWIGYVKSQYALLFGDLSSFPENFPEDEGIYIFDGEGRTEISWVETYREFVGCIDWFIEELLKLGNPKEVRIIFWLDY
ncbi:hypothetical protein [Synechocystis sp. PCC 7509]|uniref:hypothetical protein n=1 Tax=Synechocystis sp. PCC 7509 TaxID=927677 RepID=UPI0002ACF6C8|nr:hypothetical protein [Synechocystis sp. PCC 7509]